MQVCLLVSLGFASALPDRAAGQDSHYRIVPLEVSPDSNLLYMVAWGLSDGGRVTGFAQTDFYLSPWRGGTVMFAFDPIQGFTNLGQVPGFATSGYGINEAGVIAVGLRQGEDERAYRYRPGIGFDDLGHLGLSPGRHVAWRINAAGQITGKSEVSPGVTHAFRYTPGVGMEDLGTLGGVYANGFDINALGWVTGNSRTSNGTVRVFLYKDGLGMMDLGPGYGVSLNRSGTVVGVTDSFSAALLFRGTNVVSIRLPGITDSYGVGSINDAGVFLGGYTRQISQHQHVRSLFAASESAGAIDLATLMPTNGTAGWYLVYAGSINNHGQIAGSASLAGRVTAVVLDPIPPKLSITRREGDVVLSWAPAWPGLTVEGSDALADAPWKTVPVDGGSEVSCSVTGRMRFFRLNTTGAAGWCCAPEPFMPRRRPPFSVARVVEPPWLAAYPVPFDPSAHAVLSGDGVHATVTLEGKAHDPDMRPLSVAWSEVVGNTSRAFSTSERATNMLSGPGRHELQFVASDGTLSATNRIAVDVLTPAGVITNVIAFVESHPDQNPSAKAFLACLRRAVRAFNGNDYPQGVTDLERALGIPKAESVVQDEQASASIMFFVHTVIDTVRASF